MNKSNSEKILEYWQRLGVLSGETDGDPNQAFSSDEEYWHLVDRRMLVKALRVELREVNIPPTNLVGLVGSTQGSLIDDLEQMDEKLAEQAARLDEIHEKRLGITRNQVKSPRFVRLAEKLDLSPLEIDTLQYLIALVCSWPLAELCKRRNEVGDLARLLHLDAAGFMSLVSNRSSLIRAELVRVEKGLMGSYRDADVLIDLPVVKALRGLELADEDLHVINGTVVGQLLQAEGMEIDGVMVTDAPAQPPEPDPDDDDLELDDDEEDFDFEAEVNRFLEDASENAQPEPAEPTRFLTERRSELGAYAGNAEYLDDHMEWFAACKAWKSLLMEGPDGISSLSVGDRRSFSATLRELESRAKIVRARIDSRIKATREAGCFVPRGERLKAKWQLDDFEKHVLILAAGLAASLQFREKMESRRGLEVGDLLVLLCNSLEEQVAARRYFYKNSRLVENGLIDLRGAAFGGDLLDVDVNIDQRLTDYLLGVDAEATSLVEGSHLYTPNVAVERVILPERIKSLILNAVEGFPAFQRERKRCGLDHLLDYGRGIVLLFYGASGTGKTMMANALATLLGKKVLLINFPTVGLTSGDEILKLLFREAELNDAVLFFDECDGIFQDRDTNAGISLLLSELERYEGLVIMATNRPFELDEAMRRRITLPVEFPPPDGAQRTRIWKNHIPQKMRLSDQPDFDALGYRYELTGGLIKNAILAALSSAASRTPQAPEVTPEDLDNAARNQMTARLQMTDARDRVVPRHGLNRVVLPDALRASLDDLIDMQKARRTLVSEWGFDENSAGFGVTALFHGPSGTGKTLAAMAVAYELGQAIKRVNVARVVSKWVGEGAKNIESVFDEAEHSGAVLLFDEADALFAGRSAVASATDRYANLEVAVLLQRLEEFNGVAILTTNLFENIDQAFLRRIRFVLEFPRPDKSERERLWQLHIPNSLPLADDVDLQALAKEFSIGGGQIRNAVLKAAARAAAGQETMIVDQFTLIAAAKEEQSTSSEGIGIGFVPA